ncbi:unnamed protein product [Clonostachys rosea f. rosea IK726]|uniref:ABC transporter domain-containing protein n=2 Tax=Bionectria ochroleuca TaxID=29856 RepID=A0A0B7JQM6_BIOOC|nr:unnamed protein product [Clonostachys rosea f. rosea IK726]
MDSIDEKMESRRAPVTDDGEHSSTPQSEMTAANEQRDDHPDQNVAELIRSFSMSLVRSASHAQGGTIVNPFLTSNPAMDPNSPSFDAIEWAKAFLQHSDLHPEKYPRARVGVSCRNLGVHGYGTDTDYQKNVLNILMQGPLIIKQWISHRRRKIDILQNFDGLFRSGEMILVLGRPGSGVTTLLKTIAGETNGLHLDPESHFSYQGIPMDKMRKCFRGEVIYQAEEDIHFPHLTVGQTLQFAALARTPRNRLPGVSRKLYATHLRDIVMAVFGISHTVNTKVGDAFVRGVSGGERKRVSIAEVTLSQSPIQCWDNSTRGLDSATALEFARTLRSATDLVGMCAIVAMYQASQPAYDIFDKVALLYKGRLIYFGPRDAARKYFTDMGFHCPDRQTTADFLTSLTNPAERTARVGFENRVPNSPDEFEKVWQESALRKSLLQDITTFEEEYPLDGKETEKFLQTRKVQQASWMRRGSPYTISIIMQIQLCMMRGYQRLVGEMLFPLVTIAGNAAISLLLGSIFYDLPDTADSANNRAVLLFFSILFNGLSSALEILALYVQRPIVEKHSRYAFYHPFAEAVASMICDLPVKVISTMCFNIPLYFMANLRQDAGHFFTFLLIGFTCTMTMSMILRTIGQVSRTIHQALTPAAFFILGLVIYAGYVLPTRLMQGWLRWLNYINPIAYAFEATVANEFTGRQFPCPAFVPAYPNAGPFERTCSVAGAQPGADFVDGDFYIGANYGYKKSHIWRNFGILVAYLLFFLATYILSAEFITTGRSKGEVLVFQRGHDANRAAGPEVADEESVAPGEKLNHSDRTTVVKDERKEASGPKGGVFHWRNLCYDITIKGQPRRILDGVSGWVQPGTLTALMGATGAGKTTLLDVLANRITMGVVGGDVSVDGVPRGNSFQRKIGYVQQQDIHLSTSTVREALRFSALLRQPSSVSKKEKFEYVESMIELLEMEEYADAVVGVPGEGLNVEQRKRLTIGVELAAKPDLLLFLDEPTSGLDSQTAWSIATLIRKLSDNGQAILCTIHQPSAILFQQFDRILLLAKGGKTVYFGDLGKDSRQLIDYFERQGGEKCQPEENPAEWMLKVIGAAPGSKATRDWHEAWLNSPEYNRVQTRLEELSSTLRSREQVSSEDNVATYAMSLQQQFVACFYRVWQQYWRTPSYIYAKLILSGGTALFIGVSFYDADLSMTGLQDQMFAVFMLLVVFAFLSYQTMPNFIKQREIYEARERSSKMYSWVVFMLSNIAVEIPWNSLVGVLLYVLFYYLTGMNNNAKLSDSVNERSALMFLLLWAFMLFESTFANMVIAGVEMAEVGATVSLILFAFCLIFCGVIVSRTALPGFWIFMYRVSPLTYLVSALLSTGLSQNPVTCSDIELLQFKPSQGATCGQYLEPYMELAGGNVTNPDSTDTCLFCPLATTDAFLQTIDASYDERWRNYGIMWAYIIFNVFAALFLYWLMRVPKKRLI